MSLWLIIRIILCLCLQECIIVAIYQDDWISSFCIRSLILTTMVMWFYQTKPFVTYLLQYIKMMWFWPHDWIHNWITERIVLSFSFHSDCVSVEDFFSFWESITFKFCCVNHNHHMNLPHSKVGVFIKQLNVKFYNYNS